MRLEWPTPRIVLGRELGALANSAIDLSDGLLGDLGHICQRSNVGARVEFTAVPCSADLQSLRDQEPVQRAILAGGDDYELCFTAPAANALAIEQAMAECDTIVTTIGRITADRDLIFRTPDGEAYSLSSAGYDHFSAGSA